MLGPIPAGSPEVSARGLAMPQRYSIIAALRICARYAFDLASNLVANILSRMAFFCGVSTVVGLRPHRATISTPCLVTSGVVRCPIGVLSRPSRIEAGISAEVLVTISRIAAFGIDLNRLLASSQLWIRPRNVSASLTRASVRAGDE